MRRADLIAKGLLSRKEQGMGSYGIRRRRSPGFVLVLCSRSHGCHCTCRRQYFLLPHALAGRSESWRFLPCPDLR
jgi:hypothetical protein